MSETLESLFGLAMPWWEFVLRAAAVYAALLLLLRGSSKRTLGQATPFDLIVLVLLGTAVQNALIGEDTSLLGGLLLAAVMLAFNAGVGRLAARRAAVDHRLEGRPRVLASNGVVFPERLQAAAVSRNEFDSARRQAGIAHIAQVRLAVLETSGRISFIKRERRR